MQWDVFCRVIDNFGDIGFGWRLCAELAARGATVRFWVDDAQALGWMAPAGAAGVEVRCWSDADVHPEPGDCVVETFGCGLPAAFAARVAARLQAPVWINVEYLSAEPYVERSHGLPSPRPGGPGAGLTQWYFYPGFTERTGGLLREADLASRQRRFSRADWLGATLGADASWMPAERVVSLFCYDNTALPAMLDALATEPTLLLATPGPATTQVDRVLGPCRRRGLLRAVPLPLLSQHDYDHLLWASDLNFVRGEDSFVRAQWAGVPFVWQIYPQQDHAHERKVQAFLPRFLGGAPPDLADGVSKAFDAWNGLDAPARLPKLEAWRAHCAVWRETLWRQPDLVSRLVRFAESRMLI